VRYERPRIHVVKLADILTQLGPARALIYVPCGGDDDENGD
jgi:hypothetical protein